MKSHEGLEDSVVARKKIVCGCVGVGNSVCVAYVIGPSVRDDFSESCFGLFKRDGKAHESRRG